MSEPYCTLTVEEVEPIMDMLEQYGEASMKIGAYTYPVLSVDPENFEVTLGSPEQLYTIH